METAFEYRDLPLASLAESPFNPRRQFDEATLTELAESIKAQGILAPLVVRSVGESFQIIAGTRRFRAARIAGLEVVPARIAPMTDSEALEASIVENLQRREIHPLDESQGFAALMRLGESPLTIEQIGAKCGKSPVYVLGRLRLMELAPEVAEAFAKDEIGVGHALLLAKLQPEHQREALNACYQEQYGGKAKRMLLPVRHLQQWIERNIFLELESAPFSKEDAGLVPEAGSCIECPKRTGRNKLLFADMGIKADACSDPRCYAAKIDAHVQKKIAARPKLVKISTSYGIQKQGSDIVPRSRYVEIKAEKPARKEQQNWPEYKTCKFATYAIVTEGNEKGETKRVCTNPECPIHHARKPKPVDTAAVKAEQETRRREAAIAQATGLRVLEAIANAVPIRLMKRDLLFVTEQLAGRLDVSRLRILCRLNRLKKAKDKAEGMDKQFVTFIRKADESTLGRLLVESVILQGGATSGDSGKLLHRAAEHYKVDAAAIAGRFRQEFNAKTRAKPKKSAQRPMAGKKPQAA